MNILEKVKTRIVPGQSQMNKVQSVVKQVNKALQEEEIDAECVIGGSFAKNTHLKGDHDVDLFVRFNPKKYDSDEISVILEDVLPFRAYVIDGSRDYFQFEKGDLDFEIVPVLKISEYKEAQNVTDMSPMHVIYVNSHVKKTPSLNNEIRLAKQFCKSSKVYGAESYIQGFSGHVIDLLVIYYGGFNKLISAAASWGSRVVIDMESHWVNPLKQLNKSKIISPLVLVDPIQPDRNAAAALSYDKFQTFKKNCKAYLANPSEDFFKLKEIDFEKLKEDEKHAGIVMKAWPYSGKEDVMGAKLRQAYEYIITKIKEAEWDLHDSDWEFFKGKKTRSKNPDFQPHATFYFKLAKTASEFTERIGPPIVQQEDVRKFAKQHKKTYVKGGRMYARIKRKITNPLELVDDMTYHQYFVDRVKYVEL